MKPIAFPEHNIVLGKNQPEYLPLPAYKSKDGIVVSCWRLTFWERVRVLFTGKLWFMQHTFNEPLQPQEPRVTSPFIPNPKPETEVA